MRRARLILILALGLVAAIAGSVLTMVGGDRSVAVEVDGVTQVVSSRAGSVGEVLDHAGIALGDHDTLAPAVDVAVADGARIVLRRGRLIKLDVNGRTRSLWVNALSVDEALEQVGLRAGRGAYLSASRSARLPVNGFALSVRTPAKVRVVADRRTRAVTTTAPTVAALLAKTGVRLGPDDVVSPALARYPADGAVVRVTRIRTSRQSRRKALPFQTIRRSDSTSFVGTTHVRSAGRTGLLINRYRRRTVDGRVVSEVRTGSERALEPRDRVLLVGTKARPTPEPEPVVAARAPSGGTPSADGLNWTALAGCESGNNPQAVSSTGAFRGLYQFSLATWRGVGGSGDPINASSGEQTNRAQALYRRSGAGQWPNCGRRLFS